MLREMAPAPPLRGLLGAVTSPGPVGATSASEIAAYLRRHVDSYWHPVGTCRMAPAEDPAEDPAAVTDEAGRVHGIEGCLIADCSLMPTVPRATTAMPATVIGEVMLAALGDRGQRRRVDELEVGTLDLKGEVGESLADRGRELEAVT